MLLQVSVYSQSKQAECTVVIRPNLAKALAGGNVQTICRAFFSNSHLKDEAVSRVSRIVSDECALLCSKSAQPVPLFRTMTLEQAESFSWKQAITELETKAPTLYHIISSKRNKLKKGEQQFPGLCTAVAVLLKEHNKMICGVQSYLSCALFATHIQKKVCV